MKKLVALILAIVILLSLSACKKTLTPESEAAMSGIDLGFISKDENVFAEHFTIFNLENDIKLIAIYNREMKLSNRILVLEKGESAPKDLPTDVIVVESPVMNIFLSSAPTMSLINSLESVESVKLTTKTTWYIDEVKTALKDGKMVDVGDLKAPDYETIVAKKPNLSIFSTMIIDSADVSEQFGKLDIKYIIDQSTNEINPLGRTEWVKVYGTLLGKQNKANEVFARELAITREVESNLKTIAEKDKKSVIFFYVNSKGAFNVRYSDDYLSNAIKIAGGNGIFPNTGSSGLSNITIEKELFYTLAKDADIVIYNYSLGGNPKDMKSLEGRVGDILKDFKAYKSGDIWSTSQNFYQVTDTIGAMVGDLFTAFYDENASDTLKYLNRLK